MATKEPFGHLLIDLDPKTSDCLRYCSNITEPGPSVFYLPFDKAETTPLNNEREKIIYTEAKQLRKYLRSYDSDAILVLCESLHNVLLGHVRAKVRDLENYRQIFVGVLKKKSSLDKRRALLLTETGFELIQLIIKFCFIHLS